MSWSSSGDGFASASGSSSSERGRASLPSTSRNGAVPQRRLQGRSPGSADRDMEETDTEGEQPQRLEGGEGDERSRRIIRNQYRELIYSVQRIQCNSWIIQSVFMQKTAVLTFMGINRIEVEENDSDSESISGYLPSDAWHKLGEETEKYFRRAPSFHYMLGSFKSDPPVPRQRIERQKKATGTEEKRAMPAQLKKMEESHQEATEKEVERILGLLQTHFQNDPSTPISFFDLVIDPNSFARTVENIFHVSFIIRDGFARIKLDEDKLPIIGIFLAARVEIWGYAEIVETYEITEPMISPPCHRNEDEMEID
ncbi:non-structural maintenance of chromosomes element 4 A [Amazona aestiva]|uniref:Non-structural maintenance of chromosomes element 4 n=1 Tax=Amazona aestiva TaxID=12930 RepID=A0A0Q3PPK2_AMAAE|nr:non-structural maintenance of chromosomes element 4 A [Amazona aestiva]